VADARPLEVERDTPRNPGGSRDTGDAITLHSDRNEEMATEIEAADVVDLYTELLGRGIQIWIDGGWGVDALLERQSRPHKDLDIAINQKDVPKLRRLLEERGYKEARRSGEYNVVLRDTEGREIDYHSFLTDERGKIVGGIAYPTESLTGSGTIAGHRVNCISPEFMVKFHTGYEPKEKDLKDISALCEKFGIELPEAYQTFTKS
jgi:lincosamide nucleotidyltransferase A/C/D/E